MQIRFRRYFFRKGRDVALFPLSYISFHFPRRRLGSSFAKGGGGGGNRLIVFAAGEPRLCIAVELLSNVVGKPVVVVVEGGPF